MDAGPMSNQGKSSRMVPPKQGPNRGNAGKGRPKGSPNKITAGIKAAFTEAFDKLGGVASLVKWGKENPTEFYKAYVRLAPQEHTGVDGGPIQHKHQLWKFGDKEVAF